MMPWFYFIGCLWAFAVHVHGQQGFISIDCGMPENSDYKDEVTHISYVSDTQFIDSGINRNISSKFMSHLVPHQFSNVRSFPNGSRNCYTLNNVYRGNKYLIRASFMYGDYDGQDRPPSFDLYLGAHPWETVILRNASHIVRTEIILVASMDFVSVCLVNTDHGIPFISVLELRFLDSAIYSAQYESQELVNENRSLVLFDRRDLGSVNSQEIRYAIDVYDRIWSAESLPASESFASPAVVKNNGENFQPPSAVMRTAVRPLKGSNSDGVLYFNWTGEDRLSKFHVFMHFAEIEQLGEKEKREFRVCCESLCNGPHRPKFLAVFTMYMAHPSSGRGHYWCSVRGTPNSTRPPILNAFEIYTVPKPSGMSTYAQDVEAMMRIKTLYKVKSGWMGDPCVPIKDRWRGLKCSYDGLTRITSLDLSSSGLYGEIADSLANLTSIDHLDLSANNLIGQIPDFLADLPLLKFLNLTNNKLTGSVPIGLLQKSRKGLLSLSVGGNPNLCVSESCDQQKGKNVILITAVVSSAVMALVIAVIIVWRFKERRRKVCLEMVPNVKDGSFVLDTRHFTYAEVVSITNDFQRVIGKGGFGTVYLGHMQDGTQVAVKMLSQPSSQGSYAFRTEAQLLMKVHHRNLASFVGYCDEGTNIALIYEYMAKGNLADHLSGRNANILSWEVRLRIALDVAQGLEYLHTGCKPPIVHRDVKATNILLNERLEAKIADFGLSKAFPSEGLTHVSTAVMGTTGYLDPEYYITNKLNEKSDVYSFGVVFLELITGQPAIIKNPEAIHIVQWAGDILSRGDIRNVVDPRLKEEYDVNSMWKATEIAMACIPSTSIQRFTMNNVVTELKECLVIEMARERTWRLKSEEFENKSSSSFGIVRMDAESGSGPAPR